jgi:hypothetical protein
MDVQPKLLRFLESNDVHPLGESAPVNADVRIVAATNANLDKMVAQGKFRDDLYYRLNVVKLTIPARERREEIPLLLDHFLERSMKEGSVGHPIGAPPPSTLRTTAGQRANSPTAPGCGVRRVGRRVDARTSLGAPAATAHVPAGQRPPARRSCRRDQPLNAAVEHMERALIQMLRIHGTKRTRHARSGFRRAFT